MKGVKVYGEFFVCEPSLEFELGPPLGSEFLSIRTSSVSSLLLLWIQSLCRLLLAMSTLYLGFREIRDIFSDPSMLAYTPMWQSIG